MSTWQPARPRGSARLALRILPPLALFRAVAGADALLWPFLRYSAALWTCTGLDPRTRELVILRVAATEACDYQLAQHVPLARRAGLSENAIATAIRRPRPTPPIPPTHSTKGNTQRSPPPTRSFKPPQRHPERTVPSRPTSLSPCWPATTWPSPGSAASWTCPSIRPPQPFVGAEPRLGVAATRAKQGRQRHNADPRRLPSHLRA